MLKTCYQLLFRFLGVRKLYREIVVEERFENINRHIRADLQELLTKSGVAFRAKDVDAHGYLPKWVHPR